MLAALGDPAAWACRVTRSAPERVRAATASTSAFSIRGETRNLRARARRQGRHVAVRA